MTALSTTRLARILAVALLAFAISFFALATSVRGGVLLACTLLVSSETNPVPAASIGVLVGEEVTIDGAGFTSDTDVQIDFYKDGELQFSFIEATDVGGAFSLVGFFEPIDVGAWTVTATETSVCAASVEIGVEPAGPVGVVVVGTLICPPGLQSQAEVEAVGPLACDVAVLPPDEPAIPPGHTSNLQVAEFDYELIPSDLFPRTLADATLDGGGFCDPVAMVCQFGFGYRWLFVATGIASLQITDLPDGYRFGYALVDDIYDPPDPSDPLTTDPVTGTITFDVPEDYVNVTFYLFANATEPTPEGSVGGGAGTSAPSIPDTATSPPNKGGSMTTILFGLVLAGALSTLAHANVRGIRRRGGRP